MKSSVVRKLQLHNRDTWHRNQTFIDIRKYETSEMDAHINYCKIISLSLKPYVFKVCHLLLALMSPVSKFGCLSPTMVVVVILAITHSEDEPSCRVPRGVTCHVPWRVHTSAHVYLCCRQTQLLESHVSGHMVKKEVTSEGEVGGQGDTYLYRH